MPKFKHDCPACIFLGEYKGDDLYFCPQRTLGTPSLVIRHSDEGSDYSSGIVFVWTQPYREAAQRAMDKGLITLEDVEKHSGIKWDEAVPVQTSSGLKTYQYGAPINEEPS